MRRVTGDVRGVGMGRIDHRIHPFGLEAGGQALDPAEAAGTHPARHSGRVAGSTGKRRNHLEFRPGREPPREIRRFAAAPEDENPASQNPSDLPAGPPCRSKTMTSTCVSPSSIESARDRASCATLAARGRPASPAIRKTWYAVLAASTLPARAGVPPRVPRPRSQLRHIHLATPGVEVHVSHRELRELAEAASDGQPRQRTAAQVLEQAAGKVPHVEHRGIRQGHTAPAPRVRRSSPCNLQRAGSQPRPPRRCRDGWSGSRPSMNRGSRRRWCRGWKSPRRFPVSDSRSSAPAAHRPRPRSR